MESLDQRALGEDLPPAVDQIERPEEDNRSAIEMTEKMLDSAEEKDEGINPVELSETEDYIATSEDTADEDDDEQTQQFLSLMNKAEKRNQRRELQKQILISSHQQRQVQGVEWRQQVHQAEAGEDSSDSEEDEFEGEVRNFQGVTMKKCGNMVNIKWSSSNGKVECTSLPPNIKVTRVPGSGCSSARDSKEELINRRREARRLQRQQQGDNYTGESGNQGGKRKFEDRMTLTEAKVTDFDDTKDYVDFIQAKLKNVNIKLIK